LARQLHYVSVAKVESCHEEGFMIELTETAAGAVSSAIAAAAAPIRGLRVAAKNGGCSGFQYRMGLVEEAEPEDLFCESRGVRIFLDPSSASLLSGTTIDFIESMEGTGFSFSNPQATGKNGCGGSCC
jgi:iron-sulfur cluster assembly accessory protein